jgi:hypothetical protein
VTFHIFIIIVAVSDMEYYDDCINSNATATTASSCGTTTTTIMTPTAQQQHCDHHLHGNISNTPPNNATERTPLLILSLLLCGRPPPQYLPVVNANVKREDDEYDDDDGDDDEELTSASTSSSSPTPYPYGSILLHDHHRHSDNNDGEECETQRLLRTATPPPPPSFWKFFYLSSIIIYVACNIVLLYVNLTQTQDSIEEHCYLSFHLTSFWSTFLFALVEAVVIYHTTHRTRTNSVPASTSTNNNSNRTLNLNTNNYNILYNSKSPVLMMTMILWNIGSTLGVALLFTIDPSTYEHEAHILEYIFQIVISIVDVGVVVVILVPLWVVVVVPSQRTTTTNNAIFAAKAAYSAVSGLPAPGNHHHYHDTHDHYIPVSEPISTEITNTTNDRKRTIPSPYNWNTTSATTSSTTNPNTYSVELVVLEFIIATCVLILSILTYVCYTTPDTATLPDGWSGMTTTTMTTIRQSMVQTMGGPEHAAHTIEFVTEVLNGLFVFIFTYVSS